ncbi:MAG: alpha/beta hydrolase [Chloroflexota bacterium]
MTNRYRSLLTLLLLVAFALGLLARHGVNQWTRPVRVRARQRPSAFGLSHEEVAFPSRDGVRLRGWLIEPPPLTLPRAELHSAREGDVTPSPVERPAPRSGRGWRDGVGVIFCHGHGGDKSPDLRYAPWFAERGIATLLFDFRNHGDSDGDLTAMGFYERYDLLGAIDFMVSRGFTRIGLYGFSMGAATAIGAAPRSAHVVCVVADSPFAQLQPTLARAMTRRGFPRWFADHFIRVIMWWGARRLRCDPREADPVRAVSHFGQRPLLIILGARDEYIEPWQARRLCAEASGPTELWLVPDATHRDVEKLESGLYREKVMGFFERWLIGEADRRGNE